MHWESYSHDKIKQIVFGALKENLDYRDNAVLGLPASYLDTEVFYHDAPFLKEAPYLSALIANPNHIGCHTLNESESAFRGTHKIEKDLIDLCVRPIFEGGEDDYDGYVASGGTEANIQALWVLKNYYIRSLGAKPEEIAVLYSTDAHYSMPKGVALLSLNKLVTDVDVETRKITRESVEKAIEEAKSKHIKYLIVVMNMATTMFGSVDDIDEVTSRLDRSDLTYRVHVDGAYGGYIYPFSTRDERYTFKNSNIDSFTLDGHKMLQSPYGTGIYLTRKGLMEYALTEEANYVKGKDYTLIGSRSGANSIAVWMIMRTYGSDGWKAKIRSLIRRTDRLCSWLDAANIEYFRNPDMNIVTVKAQYIPNDIAEKYLLVPDSHEGDTQWWKIVVMEHVTQGMIDRFLFDLNAFQAT